MKLQHLPIGTRFEFEGKIFVKTGPLTASSEQGGQRMIPRSALLKPLDGVQQEAKPGVPRKLDEAVMLKAFEAFYGDCERLVDESARFELATARQKFLQALR